MYSGIVALGESFIYDMFLFIFIYIYIDICIQFLFIYKYISRLSRPVLPPEWTFVCLGVECLHATLHSVNLLLVTPAYRRALTSLARRAVRRVVLRGKVRDETANEAGVVSRKHQNGSLT